MGKEIEAPSDIELMAKVKNGDPDALGRLYERYAQSIFGFIYRRSEDPDLAWDVVQDTFILVWTGKFSLDHKASFRTWLYSVAKHRFIDIYRKGKGRREITGLLGDKTADDEPLIEVEDEKPPVEETVERLDARRVIQETLNKSMNKLNKKASDALLLHYKDELTIPQMAARLKESKSCVKSRLNRARTTLRQDPQVQALKRINLS